MINKFSSFIERLANWKFFTFFILFYLFFAGYVLKNAEDKINTLAGKKIGVIDLTFGFDPGRTLSMVAEYGDPARAYYAMVEMTADVAYPIIYAFLFGIILSFLYRRKQFSRINVLPFITMLFDYAENVNVVSLLYSFPGQSNAVAILLESFKLLKWSSLGICVVFILVGLLNALLTLFKRSSQS
ncbi:MAG: hypothetical protein K1X68_09420 [Saprospiraceae bacterium]|nr:hypothetical protein [Saprospiraceae bacterium]HMW38041.1 hypothetical protein [Saprospiraceae bacterium]HMX87003.1 hypothetical protein [Saprospiraceae bacterium]HMZ39818.1 hypothetical protein [Saprospiraceae bacterium]HNA65766.1 hypothetical protein [Saprospiraceae bacterium]